MLDQFKEQLNRIENRVLANGEILLTLTQMELKLMALFDSLSAKITKLTNAADGMDAVLQDVKKRLDDLIANGSLNTADAATLQTLSDAIDAEGDKIIADTLANTPAAAQAPTP